jgi:hypothetical protein
MSSKISRRNWEGRNEQSLSYGEVFESTLHEADGATGFVGCCSSEIRGSRQVQGSGRAYWTGARNIEQYSTIKHVRSDFNGEDLLGVKRFGMGRHRSED